jgi:hypothetical protein
MASSCCDETVYSLLLNNIDFKMTLSLIKVIPDGSCFFHAVLRSFNVSYIRSNSKSQRQIYVQNLRKALAHALEEIDPTTGLREYDKLGGGSYNEYNKAVSSAGINNYSLEGLQRELLSSDPVDHVYIEILSNHLNKDIYIINSITKDLYTTGTDLKLLYRNRDSIVIYYSPGHYDIIGIRRVATQKIDNICNIGDIIFDCLFNYQHPFIQALNKRMKELVKE